MNGDGCELELPPTQHLVPWKHWELMLLFRFMDMFKDEVSARRTCMIQTFSGCRVYFEGHGGLRSAAGCNVTAAER